MSRSAGQCSVYVDVRTLPEQPLSPVMRELRELVRSLDGQDAAYKSEVDFYATIPGSEISPEEELVQAVRRAHQAVHGEEPGRRFSQATNDAAHPNVGHLFGLFLASPEAQRIWEKYNGQTSAFVPGTSTYQYVQGKKMVYMSKEQAEIVDRLDREYGKILGFTK